VAALVLDVSVALSWLMPDERPAGGGRSLDRVIAGGGLVPSLWPIEIGNALLVAGRRRRVSTSNRTLFLRELAALPITVDDETPSRAWTDSLSLADRYGLTLYDATYLELAMRSGLPLATLDDALAQAARRASVEVL